MLIREAQKHTDTTESGSGCGSATLLQRRLNLHRKKGLEEYKKGPRTRPVQKLAWMYPIVLNVRHSTVIIFIYFIPTSYHSYSASWIAFSATLTSRSPRTGKQEKKNVLPFPPLRAGPVACALAQTLAFISPRRVQQKLTFYLSYSTS
jgi:hypothetical protein